MINTIAIDCATVEHYPYKHAIIKNFIEPGFANVLVNHDPNFNSIKSSRDNGSDKTYSVENNILWDLHTGRDNLNTDWNNFLDHIIDTKYLVSVSNFFQCDIRSDLLEVTFKKYYMNDFISPHTDRDFSIGTHLIFLNEFWDESWGGMLKLHDSELKVIKSIPPLNDTSVLFERSETSWHSVSKCSTTNVRYSLQIAFWRNLNKLYLPGRIEVKS